MKLFFLLLFSLVSHGAHAASCCVANTSVPNLMILPLKWQQTFTLASSKVVGNVSPGGQSTFNNSQNRDSRNIARMDLAYGWTPQYQSGVSLRYQNRNVSMGGKDASDSGWSDVGLFQAYQPVKYQRTYLFNSINLPTSNSVYDSSASFAVDSRGSGTYQGGVGIFHLINFKSWDLIGSTEVHHSFARTFGKDQDRKEVGGFWGTSATVGAGYIPWRSKFRYGFNLSPRFEGPKTVRTNGIDQPSKQSVVWDSVTNLTYTYNEKFALGLNYLDQTWFGPARNTQLNRSVSFVFQTHFL